MITRDEIVNSSVIKEDMRRHRILCYHCKKDFHLDDSVIQISELSRSTSHNEPFRYAQYPLHKEETVPVLKIILFHKSCFELIASEKYLFE